MRAIIFRGKRIVNGEWCIGFYCQVADESDGGARVKHVIVVPTFKTQMGFLMYEVDPSTIGQYTGLTVNGKKIFEGDIISCGYLCDFFVEYSEEDAEYWANFGDSIGSLHTYFDPKRATVIGNIYDNPELLEV